MIGFCLIIGAIAVVLGYSAYIARISTKFRGPGFFAGWTIMQAFFMLVKITMAARNPANVFSAYSRLSGRANPNNGFVFVRGPIHVELPDEALLNGLLHLSQGQYQLSTAQMALRSQAWKSELTFGPASSPEQLSGPCLLVLQDSSLFSDRTSAEHRLSSPRQHTVWIAVHPSSASGKNHFYYGGYPEVSGDQSGHDQSEPGSRFRFGRTILGKSENWVVELCFCSTRNTSAGSPRVYVKAPKAALGALTDREIFRRFDEVQSHANIFIWKFRIEGIMADDHGRNSITQAVYNTHIWRIEQDRTSPMSEADKDNWAEVRFDTNFHIPVLDFLFRRPPSTTYAISTDCRQSLYALFESSYQISHERLTTQAGVANLGPFG